MLDLTLVHICIDMLGSGVATLTARSLHLISNWLRKILIQNSYVSNESCVITGFLIVLNCV